jgi:hypothetical protein
MFIEGDAVYSYGHHFPIALRDVRRRVAYCNEDGYSVTTGRHKSEVFGYLHMRGFKTEYVPTRALQQLISREPAIVERRVAPKDESELKGVIVEYLKGQGISAVRAHREAKMFLERSRKFALLASIEVPSSTGNGA